MALRPSACLVALLAFLAGCNNKAAGEGETCTWRLLPVSAAQPDRREYVGVGKRVELRVPNERTDVEPDAFPEGPLKIKQVASGSSCNLAAGDVRVRNSIYLSEDESRLLVQEYSGSNDALVLYDTASCRKLTQLDVSGSKWKLQPPGVVVGTDCKGDDLTSCRTMRNYAFGNTCQSIDATGSSNR
jgi:uncharacterized membrane protein